MKYLYCSDLKIKKDLILAVTDAFLTEGYNTRSISAKVCGISPTTAGKVANSLISNGIFEERTILAPIGHKRSCRHLFPSKELSVIVIDLTSVRFSLTVVDSNLKAIYSKDYEYDPLLDLDDNLTVFLSRAGLGMPYKAKGPTQICVLLSERPEGLFLQDFLPRFSDKPLIDRIIAETYGKIPLLYISEKDAFGAAIKYGINGTRNCSVAYIRENEGYKCFSYCNGISKICYLDNLMIENTSLTVANSLPHSKDEHEKIISRLINFADVAFSPNLVLIGEQSQDIDEYSINQIEKNLILSGVPRPIIKLCSKESDIRVLGAARATVRSLIEIIIK